MTGRRFSVLSLPVVAVLIGALTIAVIFVGRYWNLGSYTFFLLAIPVAVAVAYLAWYRTLPYEPSRPRAAAVTAPSVEGDEPFVDPVEEADEFDSEAKEKQLVDEEEAAEPAGTVAPPENDEETESP